MHGSIIDIIPSVGPTIDAPLTAKVQVSGDELWIPLPGVALKALWPLRERLKSGPIAFPVSLS